MSAKLTGAGIIYLSLALTAACSVLGTTLGLYIAWDEKVPATFSAAVVNTAATLAAATFVGVFDMFFTIQQLRRNEADRKQWQAELEKAREEERARREEERARREESDARLEQLLEEHRAERAQGQQQIASLLEQNLALQNRLIELLERRNGGGAAA